MFCRQYRSPATARRRSRPGPTPRPALSTARPRPSATSSRAPRAQSSHRKRGGTTSMSRMRAHGVSLQAWFWTCKPYSSLGLVRAGLSYFELGHAITFPSETIRPGLSLQSGVVARYGASLVFLACVSQEHWTLWLTILFHPAHRVLIVRKLKGLEDFIPFTSVSQSLAFTDSIPNPGKQD